ncbi:hypothetical protein FIBSPDRAFT_737876, partial [Athelia psychrophila]
CPRCKPTVTFDLSQPQRVLEHIASHILHDIAIDRDLEACGLCLRPSPQCQLQLQKPKGCNGNPAVNINASSCPNLIKFQYKVAAHSSPSSPCSNVPISCPLCSAVIWRYNLCVHFRKQHQSSLHLPQYTAIWTLSNIETYEMAKIWKERHKKVIKRGRKKVVAPRLRISEAHSSRLTLK